MTFNIENRSFDYHVIYSKRKSIEIRIEATGEVQLKVPKNTTDKIIRDVLGRRSQWILEKIESLYKTSVQKRQYESGEKVRYLGEQIPTIIMKRHVSKGQISKVDNELIMIVPKEASNDFISKMMIAFYKKLLKTLIVKRVKLYQHHFEHSPNKISVRDQKTRWGSCSSKRNLSFNYRLLMAPIEVIDYIVIHEMCHMEHMDHSKSYWKRVHEVMPDYKTHELWLKDHGRWLHFDFMEVI
ncbi:MAG: M48 family metallopeptidase [Clostridiales bacterium]|nr:M48 family metallopeptidase [Clostridiales bacterium]